MIDIIAIVFWSFLGLVTAGVWIEHLVRYLRNDGYGSVPPPRSHAHEVVRPLERASR